MQMGNVNVNIDGKKLKVREGVTILEAAEANGIKVPTPVSYTHLTLPTILRV